jgi:uncharacterized membrane-anchored protein
MTSRTDDRIAGPAVRVPAITAWFWIVKILTTGAGESTADFLAHRFNPVLAASAAGIGLIASLVIQFRMRRYVASAYWFAVVMVAIFGTMAADVLHDGLHIPYTIASIVLAVVLIVMFVVWYRKEHTLSIHSITTRRREGFYWATVIATFALGTAVGDLTATTLGWGYLASGIGFGIAMALVGVAYRLTGGRDDPGHEDGATGAVVAFWTAYILTRPLGASFADWIGKPVDRQGLGVGDGTVAIALLVVIIALVAYLGKTKRDVPVSA